MADIRSHPEQDQEHEVCYDSHTSPVFHMKMSLCEPGGVSLRIPASTEQFLSKSRLISRCRVHHMESS